MRDSTSYVDPDLKMRVTFALATVFDSKVEPGAPPSLKALHSQSNLKVSTDLGYCKVFNPFYNLNCSA
jgi:hypothetical protein